MTFSLILAGLVARKQSFSHARKSPTRLEDIVLCLAYHPFRLRDHRYYVMCVNQDPRTSGSDKRAREDIINGDSVRCSTENQTKSRYHELQFVPRDPRLYIVLLYLLNNIS